MPRFARLAAVLGFAAVLSGCALHSPSVAELKYNPGRYQNKTVYLNGVVTSSWGVPMMPFKVYKIDAERPYADQRCSCPGERARQRCRDVRRLSRRSSPGADGNFLRSLTAASKGEVAGPRLLYAVMRTATAVMSSFGGVSPRQSDTAAKIPSTTLLAG
jgi:hypothetical protein